MPTFDFTFTVNAPLADVREFHRDTSALKRLTPPPTIVQLHDVEPLGEGSVSRFTLWVGPLPLRWTAVHRDVSERGFTDVQREVGAHAYVQAALRRTDRDSGTYRLRAQAGIPGTDHAIAVCPAESLSDVHLSKTGDAAVSSSPQQKIVSVTRFLMPQLTGRCVTEPTRALIIVRVLHPRRSPFLSRNARRSLRADAPV
jgi:hypothetical protein